MEKKIGTQRASFTTAQSNTLFQSEFCARVLPLQRTMCYQDCHNLEPTGKIIHFIVHRRYTWFILLRNRAKHYLSPRKTFISHVDVIMCPIVRKLFVFDACTECSFNLTNWPGTEGVEYTLVYVWRTLYFLRYCTHVQSRDCISIYKTLTIIFHSHKMNKTHCLDNQKNWERMIMHFMLRIVSTSIKLHNHAAVMGPIDIEEIFYLIINQRI